MFNPIRNPLTGGGYRYGQWTGEVWHPGEDENTEAGNGDLGEPVFLPDYAEIYKTVHSDARSGYGNQVIAKLKTCFIRLAHLLPFDVKEGDQISPFESRLRMGKTGAAASSHLHWELPTSQLIAHLEEIRPGDWWKFYPEGYSKKWIEAMYLNPLKQLTPYILVKGDMSPKVYAMDIHKIARHIPDERSFQEGFLNKQWGNWETITTLPQHEVDALSLNI